MSANLLRVRVVGLGSWVTAVGLAATGCGGESGERGGAPLSVGIPGDDGVGDGAATDGDDDGQSQGDEPDDGGEERLDIPAPAPPTDSCFAADLLFVIDNSGSMCEAQEGLASVIPDLVDTMFETLPEGTDLHVGVVTTSFSHGGSHGEQQCRAVEGPGVIEDHFTTDTVVDHNGYQGRLFEYDGMPYFSARTHQPEAREALTEWFSGAIVEVGCSGGAFDFPVAAAGFAASPQNEASNGGFIRDEGAALAIFVLTNETDHSPGGVAGYIDMILEAKSACGGAECVLTGGLLATNCVPSGDPPVWQFLNGFGAPTQWGDIKDFSLYEDVVARTLGESLAETCDEIGPVG